MYYLNKLALTLSLVTFSTIALADQNGGDRGGNGGDLLVCRKGEKIISAQMVDLYEGQSRRGFKLDLGDKTKSIEQKLQMIFSRLQVKDPVRAQVYSAKANEYLQAINDKSALIELDHELVDIPDHGYLAIPKNCKVEQVAVQMVVEIPGDMSLSINADLWNLMDNDNKTMLILHEVVYHDAIANGHKNSIKTRYLTAYLASTSLQISDQDQYLAALSFADLFFPVSSKRADYCYDIACTFKTMIVALNPSQIKAKEAPLKIKKGKLKAISSKWFNEEVNVGPLKYAISDSEVALDQNTDVTSVSAFNLKKNYSSRGFKYYLENVNFVPFPHDKYPSFGTKPYDITINEYGTVLKGFVTPDSKIYIASKPLDERLIPLQGADSILVSEICPEGCYINFHDEKAWFIQDNNRAHHNPAEELGFIIDYSRSPLNFSKLIIEGEKMSGVSYKPTHGSGSGMEDYLLKLEIAKTLESVGYEPALSYPVTLEIESATTGYKLSKKMTMYFASHPAMGRVVSMMILKIEGKGRFLLLGYPKLVAPSDFRIPVGNKTFILDISERRANLKGDIFNLNPLEGDSLTDMQLLLKTAQNFHLLKKSGEFEANAEWKWPGSGWYGRSTNVEDAYEY